MVGVCVCVVVVYSNSIVYSIIQSYSRSCSCSRKFALEQPATSLHLLGQTNENEAKKAAAGTQFGVLGGLLIG